MNSSPDVFQLLVLLAFFALVYFLPAIVAAKRHHRNTGAIFMLDLLTGWSFIGWVAAIVWAMTADVVPASDTSSTQIPVDNMASHDARVRMARR